MTDSVWQVFSGKNFSIRGTEDASGNLWFLLEDVLKTLQLGFGDLKDLGFDDFQVINDTCLIKEGGFYYLALFVSTTPESQEFAHWVFHDVLGSIATKGYYKVGEN